MLSSRCSVYDYYMAFYKYLSILINYLYDLDDYLYRGLIHLEAFALHVLIVPHVFLGGFLQILI